MRCAAAWPAYNILCRSAIRSAMGSRARCCVDVAALACSDPQPPRIKLAQKGRPASAIAKAGISPPAGCSRRRSNALAGKQDAYHAPKRLGRAPQQLVADGERAQIFAAHRELAQAADGHFECAGHGRRRQLADALLAQIRYHPHPVTGGCEDALDLRERNVAPQLDRQRLRVAAHRADAHADGIDRDDVGAAAAEDLVGLGTALPLLAAHAIAEILVDPRYQAAGERHAEVLGREILVTQYAGDLAIDVEDRRVRVVE